MSQAAWVTRSIRLPEALDAKLKRIAQREMSSVNREIVIAVRAHADAAEGKGSK